MLLLLLLLLLLFLLLLLLLLLVIRFTDTDILVVTAVTTAAPFYVADGFGLAQMNDIRVRRLFRMFEDRV